ncbi:MAG: FkbM family methyltransferase [Opitutaceae bacterium]|nr:FkbM family methyltransferase [Opitutaceae bacterium]
MLWDDTLPQPATHAHLRHLLQLHQIDLLIDVGANRGQFVRTVRRLGYAGEIISFEPLASHQAELAAAAGADGRWRTVRAALGQAAGERKLHVYRDDTFSSLHPVNEAGLKRFHGLVIEDHVERVPVHSLDYLWPELTGGASRRVLLKTDTQGHDLAVLSGSIEVLRSTHAIMIEAALQPIYVNAPLFAEVAAWLADHGFVPSGLYPISHRPEDLALIEMDAFFTRPRA